MIMKRIICFLFGHKPIRKVHETEFAIWQRECERCKCALGMPKAIKFFKDVPPPGSSKWQIISWEVFCEKKFEEARQL